MAREKSIRISGRLNKSLFKEIQGFLKLVKFHYNIEKQLREVFTEFTGKHLCQGLLLT